MNCSTNKYVKLYMYAFTVFIIIKKKNCHLSRYYIGFAVTAQPYSLLDSVNCGFLSQLVLFPQCVNCVVSPS